MKTIEINNEGNKDIWAMACQVKLSGNVFVHIGQKESDLHEGKKEKVETGDYAILEINNVEV